jgi:hypothetical protein
MGSPLKGCGRRSEMITFFVNKKMIIKILTPLNVTGNNPIFKCTYCYEDYAPGDVSQQLLLRP